MSMSMSITLTLTLQEVSHLTNLLKHHIDDLNMEYEITPEPSLHMVNDIAIAQETLVALQEAIRRPVGRQGR